MYLQYQCNNMNTSCAHYRIQILLSVQLNKFKYLHNLYSHVHDIIILISYVIIFIEPENVTVVESVTYISVSWSPVESPYCGGVLYYVCSLIHHNTTIKITTNRYFCKFNELNPSTPYYISIAAVNRAVIGEATFIYATTDCKLFYTYHFISFSYLHTISN